MRDIKHRAGMTLVELMVVVAVLASLVALISIAAQAGRSSELMMKSRNHLRQIAQWMDQYASNHRDTVVPSRFDYWREDAKNDVTGDGIPDEPSINRVGGARFYRSTAANEEWLPTANPFDDTLGPRESGLHQGSWADIIWVDANLGDMVSFDESPVAGTTQASVYGGVGRNSQAAPGWWMFRNHENRYADPLRSAAPNTMNFPKVDGAGNQTNPDWGDRGIIDSASDAEGRKAGLPTPIGGGAWEKDLPGFFAANGFFDARSRSDVTGETSDPNVDRFVATAQVRAPSRAMYLVDSFRGETIGESPLADREVYESRTHAAFTNWMSEGGGGVTSKYGTTFSEPLTQEIDFRYAGNTAALMMFLDGHVRTMTGWQTYDQLVGNDITVGMGVQVMDLDSRLGN
ncbi:MAG: prepilin-type N-terminal cleavage/methylation domain-containing protein [Planctomycetes bacterium]|nr:prepilin-type N-terminal cleavage/methylation domain-containing protein [Planctomycetota bacterium]